MRLLCFVLLLASCTSLNPFRKIAAEEALVLSLSESSIFANGADFLFVTVEGRDYSGAPMLIDPAELKMDISEEIQIIEPFQLKNGKLVAKVRPPLRGKDISIQAHWRHLSSQTQVLKTFIAPIRDKMEPIHSNSNSSVYMSGLSYSQQANFPDNRFEGFSIDNTGENRIVNAEESQREFSFSFEEQVRQNISFMVTDSPNGYTSHGMYSHFMLFPRKQLPLAEVKADGNVEVTLANGESMVFDKQGMIVDGVFTEGPVDVGPDRFKRQYADLKYKGKGILLRANARGQLPQQGQFETTPIDMEYGLRYSFDVLIINGETGQRCRRPKKDFWLMADVSPVEFKFPDDESLNVYLLKNCKFGIPKK